MWLRPFRLFVRPPASVYAAPDLEFLDGAHTYGEYNYLRPGLASRVKTAHFEQALRETRAWFGRCGVLDFGCADGVFLPSLARHFPHVTAVDRVPHFIEVAERVVRKTHADNVQIVCNEALSMQGLRERLENRPHGIAFCLEVIEHVGTPGDLYGPKVALLGDLLELLEPPGWLVVSVPVMVGIPFLLQRGALFALGGYREQLSTRELLRCGLLRDARPLEPRWDGGHVGFSHLRLEEEMRGRVHVRRRKHMGFQVLYVLERASCAGS